MAKFKNNMGSLDNYLLNTYLDIVTKSFFKKNVLTETMFKQDFIKAVEEYNKISKSIFNIFKKRRLEKQISMLSQYIIEDVKKINKGKKITFKRYSKLEAKK